MSRVRPVGERWGWAVLGVVVTAGWAASSALGDSAGALDRAAAAGAAAVVAGALAPASLETLLASAVVLAALPVAVTRPVPLVLATVLLGLAAAASDWRLLSHPLATVRSQGALLGPRRRRARRDDADSAAADEPSEPALLSHPVATVSEPGGPDLARRRRARQLASSGALHAAVPLLGALLVAAGPAVTAADGLGWSLTPSGDLAATLTLAGLLVLLLPPAFGRDDGDIQRKSRPNAASGRGLRAALLVPAALAAAYAVPALPHLQAVVALGVVAAALAAFHREPHALTILGLGAVALTSTRPAGLLLAAAGVLATVLPTRAALLAALPGAVALTAALGDHPLTGPEYALAAAAAATAGLVAWRHAAPTAATEPRLLPAAGLALWLAMLPGTWRWTGSQRVAAYQDGAALAAAGAGFAVIAALAWLVRHGRVPQAHEQGAPADAEAEAEP